MFSIFLNFFKSCDTFDYNNLCRKLESFGIRCRTLEWLRSHLAGSTQFTEISQTESTIRNTDKGVPQGSILGPLRRVIYVNDMNKCIDLKLVYYALDNTTFKTLISLNLLADTKYELSKISDWLCNIRLSYNALISSFTCYSVTLLK